MLPATHQQTLENSAAHLLSLRTPDGLWEGELSSSALSTATAVIALSVTNHSAGLDASLTWLRETQNTDGGWGDTTRSLSNISTSLLVTSALTLAGNCPENAWTYIESQCGGRSPDQIARTVADRYGKDRTFSVPILMACAIGGILGDDESAWHRVLPLPFELAAFPRKWFAALQLPVVSYALPALIAIGYARHVRAPIKGTPWRAAAWRKTAKLLATLQPESGGFLEATPLTAFVTMGLASAGEHEHPVVPRAVKFLKDSLRPDGSWPIDTNLATWVSTLSIKALGSHLPEADRPATLASLKEGQYEETHPFTLAAPGGWAWTPLSGGVPDADDTPGALLALHQLDPTAVDEAAAGIRFLLGLQNRDGGIPTFCRGWGTLPFDRSSPDLTAHTLRAFHVWLPSLDSALASEVRAAMRHGLSFLKETQQADGSWLPLWFGNQHAPEDINPTYGTSQVILALTSTEHFLTEETLAATRWLTSTQNADGGWGGAPDTPSSIEETALAAEALTYTPNPPLEQLARAAEFLTTATSGGTSFPATPIGFYFAKLWYYEKIYPVAWTVAALRKINALP